MGVAKKQRPIGNGSDRAAGETRQRFPTRKGADFAMRYRGTEMLGTAPNLCKEVDAHMATIN